MQLKIPQVIIEQIIAHPPPGRPTEPSSGPRNGKDLQGGHGIGRPGVVINCCPSVLECRDAVVCSEVPTFRYEFALGPAEQQTAEHGTSVHCL